MNNDTKKDVNANGLAKALDMLYDDEMTNHIHEWRDITQGSAVKRSIGGRDAGVEYFTAKFLSKGSHRSLGGYFYFIKMRRIIATREDLIAAYEMTAYYFSACRKQIEAGRGDLVSADAINELLHGYLKQKEEGKALKPLLALPAA